MEAVPNRRICNLTRICAATSTFVDSTDRCDLDSHADTCVAGPNTLLLWTTDRTVSVSPFSTVSASHANIRIGTVATLWQNPATGKPYILIIHEALYFGKKVNTTLLNPNQLRSRGLIVNDVPRQFDRSSSHSIRLPEYDLEIPLSLHGVCSGFHSTKPTRADLTLYEHIELTAQTPWEPNSGDLAENEQRAVYIRSVTSNALANPCTNNEHRLVSSVRTYTNTISTHGDLSSCLHHDDVLTVDPFHHGIADRIISSVIVNVDVEPDTAIGDLTPDSSSGDQQCAVVSTTNARWELTPESLARKWGIGLSAAKTTLRRTTQAGVHNILAPGERKVRQKLFHLKYPSIRARIYSDTMFSRNDAPSIRKNTCAQVYTNGSGLDYFFPMADRKEVDHTLQQFIMDVGIPQTLITDNAKELVGGKFRQLCLDHQIKQEFTVPHSPWHNLAETAIRILKGSIIRTIRRTKCPRALWCYCGQWVAGIRRLTSVDRLDGATPTEAALGSTPDISQYVQFDWYQPVYYHDPTVAFPHDKKSIGRFVGVAENSTDIMSFLVLTQSGEVLTRKSVWGIPPDDLANPEIKSKLDEFDSIIDSLFRDGSPPETMPNSGPPLIFEDEPDGDELLEPYDPLSCRTEMHDFAPEAFDNYLTATLLLPRGGLPEKAIVTGRHKDHNGIPVGSYHQNPLLDSRIYDVEFSDGTTEAVSANTLAESIYSQVDEEGHSHSIFKEVIGHRSNDSAVPISEGTFVNRRGLTQPRITTRGWDLEVEWKDGTSSWVPLRDLKESNPIEIAEYAVANHIANEPAFAWWVLPTLRRRNRIIAKVKRSKTYSDTMKFGIELPRTVEEALAIDKRTKTHFWEEAIQKEMRTVDKAFDWVDNVPIGYKQIKCHLIFDVKMDLTRKARFVAGGHMTDPPKESTYSSVVSRDSIRLAFLVAALNDLDILSCDVQGAYLNAATDEKVWIKAGLEFGQARVGQKAIIRLALYGLRSSGARWRDHMAATLRDVGFKSCLADPDVWMRPRNKENGDPYWEYVLVYVDDILCVSHVPQEFMDYLSSKYTLKAGSVGPPTQYLGAQVSQFLIEQPGKPNRHCWAMSSDVYVHRAVSEVESKLAEKGTQLSTKAETPLQTDYRPELDTSPLLDAQQLNYYQGLIGVLRWICELGRIDILVQVSMMSRYMAAPREGHLLQVFHIFAYLKRYNHSRMVFDDIEPVFPPDRFRNGDWSQYYPDAAEAIPPNAPEPRGKAVTSTCYVDADHAGCRVTRRSHSGVLIYVNRAPIVWYSKRQNTVETSTFGSEYVAAKIAVELIEGLRYKLRMMGIPIAGPTNMLCDNESVVNNSSRPESVLKKRHNAIAYHRVRESQAADVIRIAHEDGETNVADMLTKCLAGKRLRILARAAMG